MLALEAVLADLAALAAQHGSDATHPHDVGALHAVRGRVVMQRALAELAAEGLAQRHDGGGWSLTAQGLAEASRLARTRRASGDAP